MFGFDNTRDNGSQPQGQPQAMSAPAMPDPMSTPPPAMPSDTYQNASTQQPDPMSEPVASPFADTSSQDNTSAPAESPKTDLLSIKQEALQRLSPLVGHLDQSPEEKFKTTMMMIQASDDQTLVGAAYEAANAITDEKVKAQALLDIVNEINYFTQHSSHEG